MRKKTCCQVSHYLQYIHTAEDRYCGYIYFAGNRMDYKEAVKKINNGEKLRYNKIKTN